MEKKLDPKEQITRLIASKWFERPLLLCAKLKIPDILGDSELSLEEIAKQSKTHTDSQYRLLRAMASIGVFEETNSKIFKNTELSHFLKSSSLGPMAVFMGADWHNRAWDNLEHSIRTGQTAFEKVYGKPFFDWLGENPEASSIFNNAMTGGSSIKRKVIAESYDFSNINTIVDVGGGHGALLTAILKLYPNLKGIVYDLPEVIAGAKTVMESSDFKDQIVLKSGSFFDSVPKGDCHIMSHIIHDWDDDSCVKILKNCHKAQPDNGKTLVCECIIPEGNYSSMAKVMDLEMLVVTPGGRERTKDQFASLFEKAGYGLGQIFKTSTEMNIIEAKK